ncbi:hypothetical protein ACFX1Q_024692 [Malus domestica]
MWYGEALLFGNGVSERYLPKEFATLTTVDDAYSRAMLGKQPCKDYGQSVPDRKFDFRFRLIAFFLFVLQVCLAVEDGGRHI